MGRSPREAGALLKYSLLVVKCASRQANLVILVNIFGDVVAKPHLNDRLCATRSRSFEKVLAHYMVEIAENLRRHIVGIINIRIFGEEEYSWARMSGQAPQRL